MTRVLHTGDLHKDTGKFWWKYKIIDLHECIRSREDESPDPPKILRQEVCHRYFQPRELRAVFREDVSLSFDEKFSGKRCDEDPYLEDLLDTYRCFDGEKGISDHS